MKKLILISLLTVTMQNALQAQQGLSEEGYKHWVKAITLMENIQSEKNYLLVRDEFIKVTETDPNYAETYYNLGSLCTKMGELGGGIPMFDAAKTHYDKYLELRPSERAEIIKEQAKLEVKRESFIENIGLNMVLIEGGEFKKKKSIITIEPFYAQTYMFTVADYKRLITPMAILVAEELSGEKTVHLSEQQSPTGNDNVPYILNFYTAVEIVEVLKIVTGRNYFIPAMNQNKLMEKNKNLRFGGKYINENGKKRDIVEWKGDSIEATLELVKKYSRMLRFNEKHFQRKEYVGYIYCFRLALPVSDISKK